MLKVQLHIFSQTPPEGKAQLLVEFWTNVGNRWRIAGKHRLNDNAELLWASTRIQYWSCQYLMGADLTKVYNVSEKVDDKIFLENIVRKDGKIIVISAIYTTANRSVSKKDIHLSMLQIYSHTACHQKS